LGRWDENRNRSGKDRIRTKLKAADRIKSKLINEYANISQSNQPHPETETQERDKISRVEKELSEQRVIELARTTREKGFGQLYGFTLPVDKAVQSIGFYPGLGFAIGNDIVGSYDDYQSLLKIFRPHQISREIWDGYEHKNRQVWAAGPYNSQDRWTL